MFYRWTLPLVLTLIAIAGCGRDADEPSSIRRSPQGIMAAESRFDYATTVSRLDSILQLKPVLSVAARIDHAANAESADLSLRPTYVTLFNSPPLHVPMMQHNPTVGLDLPQRVLVYQTPDGRAMLVYDSADYLATRHGLSGVQTVRTLRSALRGLAKQITNSTVTAADSVTMEAGAGIVQVESDGSVDATFDRLKSAVEQNEALSIMAEIDHTANAERFGMELPPIRLLVFGNLPLGTPLMQAAPTMALDLPQKMLVYEAEDGTVRIAYNDPTFLAERHVVTDQAQRLQTIANALASLAEQAADGG